jgi:hypothetical protein
MDNHGRNRDGEIVHHDADGRAYVLDEAGNRRPPMRSQRIETASGFTVYDDSEGHCGLCGSLTCRGGCFK